LSESAGPIVIVGAHVQGLFMRVAQIAGEGESAAGWGFAEPEDGGKATNQAIAAAKLGAPVSLVSVVGSDDRGRRALHYLEREGVDIRWVTVADGATDVGFVMLPPSKVPAIASAQDRSRDLDRGLVEAATPAIRSGSVVLAQLEAPAEAALAAFRIARNAGVTTVFNPSPVTEPDPRLLSLVDYLVPNEHEAAVLVGRQAEPVELALELAARWAPTVVLVTAGAEGAFVASAGRCEHVGAPRVEVADTTGAGDAFVAALAVRLRNGEQINAAARFAVRAASISVTRAGTMPSFPRAAEVDGSFGRAAVKTL
jgi:ribokinase